MNSLRTPRAWLAALVVVVTLGGVAVVVAPALSAPAGRSSATGRTHSAHAGRAAPPPPPVTVTAISPADGATGVAATADVTVTFSAAVPPRTTPVLTPALPGSWQHPTPDTLVFHPTSPTAPSTQLSIRVPSDVGPVTAAWTVAPGSVARLQQLLAELGYLPLTFSPAQPEPTDSDAITASAFAPVPGSFSWRYSGPPELTALWAPGQNSVMTRGAVMAFEHDHGLDTDAVAGSQVWTELTAAVSKDEQAHHPYSYVLAHLAPRPQHLELWQNGQLVTSSLMNSGIAAAPTRRGNFAVFSRLQAQVMRGTNPSGSHYADPVSWVSYFDGGNALHFIPRRSYGSPQSVGCLELPAAQAEQFWHLMEIGTLVTVE